MPFRISPNVKPNAAEPESSRNRIKKGRVKGMWTIVFVLLITLVVVFFVLDDYFPKKRQPKRFYDLHMQRMRIT